MKIRYPILWATLIILCSCVIFGQSRFPSPPPPMAPLPSEKPKVTKIQRMDTVQLQREARELSDLSRTIPGDIDNASRGVLSKDLGNKLKRIEKLAKQLRGEIER